MPASPSLSSVSSDSNEHRTRPSSRQQRWRPPRDRIDADEHPRIIMRDTQELDGSQRFALYDRPNWPFPATHDPPDDDDDDDNPGSDQAGKRGLQHEAVEMEDERAVHPNTVFRDARLGQQNGHSYPDEHDVSDLEEDELEDEAAGPGSPQSPPSRQHQSLPDLHRESRRSSASPPHQSHAEVSPIREERLPTPPVRAAPKASKSSSHRPLEQQRAGQDHINGMDEEDEEDEEHESRDTATDIPFASTSDSPVLSQDEMQGMNSSQGSIVHTTPPMVHTTPPMVNGSTFRNSILKNPMTSPLHRRTSTRNRSSWINTDNNKSHVRYSWQSMQEDGPNKPRINIIKLVSNTATASAGFPTGEAFGFSISPGGRKIAAYNSARLYVLQTNALPVGISQDYTLKRKPLAVELTDEGNTMAILADDHTVNVYDIGLHVKRVRTIKLDFPTTCIALAPTGGLLAAAYEGGVEIFSLAPSALPTDRRAVRSAKMDSLTFSDDGSTLLGTTTRINVSSTVLVNVPIFPAAPGGIPTHEELKEAWCSELLHPENVRNSSHATFMREGRKICNERVFAWNGLEDTFGILNVSDMQYGKIDFPVVISPPLSTCGGLGAAIHSCPAIDEHGDTVAMVVNDRTIRLYIVPHRLDEDATTIEAHSIDHELDEGYGCPFSEVKWVSSLSNLPAPRDNQKQVKGRLVVTSPGGVMEPDIGEDSVEDIEGGRIIMFDFDPQFAGQPGQTFSLTLGKSPPQMLEEEQTDIAEQVALVRRRTVNQSKGRGLSTRPATLGRAATTYGPRALRAAALTANPAIPAQRNRMSMISIGSMQSEAARSLPDLLESGEQADAFEEPYVQGAPRSQASLQRAASNVQRHRFQTLEERQRERISVDSHGDFLSLPEYTEEPNAPLPSRYRALAGLDQPAVFNPKKPAVVVNATTSPGASSSSASATPQTAPPDIGENFSADSAFQAANAQVLASQQAAQAAQHPPVPPMSAPNHSRPSSVTQSPMPSPTSIPPRPSALNDHRTGSRSSYRNSMTPSISSAHGTAMFTAAQPPLRNVPFDPPGRSGTFDSLSSLPRGLQRAYSNAVSPIGSAAPPSLIGDWRNVSPIVGNTPPTSYAGSIHSGGREAPSVGGGVQEEEWDTISPAPPADPNSAYGQPTLSHRYSTSLLNPPGHEPAGSSTSYPEGGWSPAQSASRRRMPPHMQVFRNAASANASASLFPPSQPPDHVPIRRPTTKASAIAHPVTAWHPPAASSTPNINRTSGSVRGNSSRSSNMSKSAFATTAKAKRLGFFKKKDRIDPYGPSARNGGMEDGSAMEMKSVMTWTTKRDSRCAIM